MGLFRRGAGGSRRTLHSALFFAKPVFRRVQQGDLPSTKPGHTAAMPQRPVVLTGFNFPKATLAAISENYEIAGHMDKPDPALVPAAARPHVQALVMTGSVGASDALMASMPRLSHSRSV